MWGRGGGILKNLEGENNQVHAVSYPQPPHEDPEGPAGLDSSIPIEDGCRLDQNVIEVLQTYDVSEFVRCRHLRGVAAGFRLHQLRTV